MKIHEFQAKNILEKFNIPIPKGFLVTSLEEIEDKINELRSDFFVVKAQIHSGGRGKAGGIKIAKSFKEIKKIVSSMLNTTLTTYQTGGIGQKIKKIYIEEACCIKKEYYLSLIIDTRISKPIFIFSSEGGVNIEETAKNYPEKIIKFDIDYNFGFQSFDKYKFNSLNLNSNQIKKISDIANNMYNVLIETDATQIEINPLIETDFGNFIAIDAKISFDDNALYRHPEIEKLRDYDEEIKEEIEASKCGLSYIKMNGSIGCMVNGAGLAMATMDIIKYYGSEPANFLDIGGSANKETIKKAFKIMLFDDNVKGILVNIFGGIMRCDVVANAIIETIKEIGIKVPLVVRLSGTNFEEGDKILKKSKLNIVTMNKLNEAAQRIIKEVNL